MAVKCRFWLQCTYTVKTKSNNEPTDLKLSTLLSEIFATRLFFDFVVHIFRDTKYRDLFENFVFKITKPVKRSLVRPLVDFEGNVHQLSSINKLHINILLIRLELYFTIHLPLTLRRIFNTLQVLSKAINSFFLDYLQCVT